MIGVLWLGVLAAGCGDESVSFDGGMPDAGSAGDAAIEASAADAGSDPDAGCTIAPVPWMPASTGGAAEEGILACMSRVRAAAESPHDARVPHDEVYALTTFGGGVETQDTACGGRADGSWFYAANAHRFSCGSRIRLVDRLRTRCVVVEVNDVGPHVCVEERTALPTWDVSPMAAAHLYGLSELGWIDHELAIGAQVKEDHPLGPCDEQLAADVNAGWIGGACASATDCTFEGASCNTEWPGGHCTQGCTTACPDREGASSYTVCADLGAGPTCLARCDFTLFSATGCRDGYACAIDTPTANGALRDVCLPAACR
jgi:hypothetical protein